MKNEFILDFTGMTVEDAEEELTRYMQAVLQPPPKSKTSRKRQLEKLKSLKSMYQTLLSDLDAKIENLEALAACDDESDWVVFHETEKSASELLRKYTSDTLRFLIDRSYSMAQESQKQVRKDDMVLVNFYQTYFDMCSSAKAPSYDCAIVKYDYSERERSDIAKFYQMLLLQRLVQFTSVKNATHFYQCAEYTNTCLHNQGRNVENPGTRAFRTMLASHLFEWRKAHGYTKQELSQSSGIERTTISNLETMRQSASIDKIIQLLETTGAALVIVPMDRAAGEPPVCE